ncbi:hypothetical protein J2X69_002993 [Algoriphagus sp. 4150]|uniref:DUF3347 domain-containing protein n=1 Tax=Algoriphagus sp. 4150 TaxID=2817756 RepID=UPI002858344B|nr:DUF3347 domain-containing protein [Algoriphagus sp. 4150]MDR7130636.1 hypothetical protein [Algoriphagus sp. 4150]
MKKLILSTLILLSFAAIATAQDTDEILKNYLVLKDALIASDNEKSGNAASVMAKSIAEAGDFPNKKELSKLADEVNKSKDLEKRRAAFAPFSEAMYTYAKNQDSIPQVLYYQYCPMKKSYWLSAEAGVKNPYYGSKMLTCGSVKETIGFKN